MLPFLMFHDSIRPKLAIYHLLRTEHCGLLGILFNKQPLVAPVVRSSRWFDCMGTTKGTNLWLSSVWLGKLFYISCYFFERSPRESLFRVRYETTRLGRGVSVFVLVSFQYLESLRYLGVESFWTLQKMKKLGVVHLQQHTSDLACKLGLRLVNERI